MAKSRRRRRDNDKKDKRPAAPEITGATDGPFTTRSPVTLVTTIAMAVLAGGLLWQFWPQGSSSARSDTAKSFVGSDTCASCHLGEAESWGASQHRHAMAHATAASVLGDFSGATFSYFGVQSRLSRRSQIFRRDRRGGRQTCELRNQIHFWRRSAAAISDRVSRRPAAGAFDRLGQPIETSWRAALVSSLSERGNSRRRRPALQAEIDAVERPLGLDLADHLADQGFIGVLGNPSRPCAGFWP